MLSPRKLSLGLLAALLLALAGVAVATYTTDKAATHKNAVRAASTSNITLYDEQTVDGVALVAGDEVLVTGQTSAKTNGIYVVRNDDYWYRRFDCDTRNACKSGTEIIVTEGTVNAGTTWVLTTADPLVMGTTSLTWSKSSGSFISSMIAAASASGPATYKIFEDSDNGTNYALLTAEAAIGANTTYTFGDDALAVSVPISGLTRLVFSDTQTEIVPPTTVAAGKLNLAEGTDNGDNYVSVRAPATLAADIVVTLPTATTDLDDVNDINLIKRGSIDIQTGVATATVTAATIGATCGAKPAFCQLGEADATAGNVTTCVWSTNDLVITTAGNATGTPAVFWMVDCR